MARKLKVKNNKIIVTHLDEIPPDMALRLAAKVIGMGRVSDNGKKYCFGTTFNTEIGDVICFADRTYAGTDTFFLRRSNVSPQPCS